MIFPGIDKLSTTKNTYPTFFIVGGSTYKKVQTVKHNRQLQLLPSKANTILEGSALFCFLKSKQTNLFIGVLG